MLALPLGRRPHGGGRRREHQFPQAMSTPVFKLLHNPWMMKWRAQERVPIPLPGNHKLMDAYAPRQGNQSAEEREHKVRQDHHQDQLKQLHWSQNVPQYHPKYTKMNRSPTNHNQEAASGS